MNAFSYHSPADNEREAFEHDMWARQDYMREAYGNEVDTMNDADDDYYDGLAAAERGITVDELHREARINTAMYVYQRRGMDCLKNAMDTIPF